MVLFVSDMHFGRGSPAEAREEERTLVSFLRAHKYDVDHLYLLGDVFEAYIEYATLIPKGFARFQGLLAEWSDAGIPVTYLVGNHDPWHLSYFEDELGVSVSHGPVSAEHFGRQIYLAHGDGLDSRKGSRIKALVRHPLPTWCYRTFLPSDAGLRLARWWSHRFGRDHIRPSLVEAVAAHARKVLKETAADLVIMGHTHRSAMQEWPEGIYANTGSWAADRSYGLLDETGFQLLKWRDSPAAA